MLHVISVRCVACDLHTVVPCPLERMCWRQFALEVIIIKSTVHLLYFMLTNKIGIYGMLLVFIIHYSVIQLIGFVQLWCRCLQSLLWAVSLFSSCLLLKCRISTILFFEENHPWPNHDSDLTFQKMRRLKEKGAVELTQAKCRSQPGRGHDCSEMWIPILKKSSSCWRHGRLTPEH